VDFQNNHEASMRQPDIEIYLKDADVDHKAITAWLTQAIGPCTEWTQKGQTWKCQAGDVPVTWMEQPVPGQRQDAVGRRRRLRPRRFRRPAR
jgi:hypothetical protein